MSRAKPLSAFTADGLLLPGAYTLSLTDLQKSILVRGPRETERFPAGVSIGGYGWLIISDFFVGNCGESGLRRFLPMVLLSRTSLIRTTSMDTLNPSLRSLRVASFSGN